MSRRARVTTSYKPVLDDELTLEVGDIITNIVDVDVGWCEGELNEEKGMFPNNFVELYTELIPRASEEMVVPQPTTTTSASNAGKKAKVMFEYEAQDDDELTLHVGDVIDVICDVGDGWWRGNLNGTIGILPSNFVELVDDKDVGQAKDKHAGIQKEAVPPEKKASGGRMGFGDLIIRAEKRLKSAESRPALSVPSSPPTVQAVNLRRQLREMEQQLREKDEQEENLQRQLREMKRQIREKDEQEENFKRQLREMEQQLTNFLDQYEEKENEMVNLQEQITTQKRELWEKDQQVNELEITLSTAQKALSKQVTPDWVISRDEIELTGKLLGKGGWGNVVGGKYCGCAVAVKQIHELILSPHNRNLFEREMDIASRCRHPCLLQFIGATNDEESPLFVTELMESSLRALLAQRPLAAREISIISLDVARALNYLHQKKPSPIIHRDISSANVLLWRQRNQWRGKVSYYGTANFMQHTMTVAPGAMIYMAPEACTPNQTIKVDLYSFGVLLCEMCLRELPDPEKRKQQIAMVTNSPLRGLIQGCVQVEPAARPNMEEIIKKLEPSK